MQWFQAVEHVSSFISLTCKHNTRYSMPYLTCFHMTFKSTDIALLNINALLVFLRLYVDSFQTNKNSLFWSSLHILLSFYKSHAENVTCFVLSFSVMVILVPQVGHECKSCDRMSVWNFPCQCSSQPLWSSAFFFHINAAASNILNFFL